MPTSICKKKSNISSLTDEELRKGLISTLQHHNYIRGEQEINRYQLCSKYMKTDVDTIRLELYLDWILGRSDDLWGRFIIPHPEGKLL